MKLATPKGFRDFLPEKMAFRNEVIRRLKAIFEKYGFEELQTPSLEYQKVLLGKYGDEAEKLMYLFKDPGKRDVGLRYDLTVPMARVVSSYPNLPKPFKRYQIQPAWRAENTQKGRYREFYQCDVDTIGSTSPLSDAEILAVINGALKALEFPSFRIKVNSRQVLFSTMEKAKIIKDLWLTTIQSIDKLDKKSKDEVQQELLEKGLSSEQIKNVLDELEKAQPDNYLKTTLEFAKKMGVSENIVFDPKLARGLDYYTGPIFESVVDEPKIGSITGGGRYDGLLKVMGGMDLPATGTTIGLDRACDVIEDLNLWPNIVKTTTKVLVTVFSESLIAKSLELSSSLRSNNINCELYLDPEAKLDKQFKYADQKGIPFVAVIGPDEVAKDLVTLKDLNTKSQETLTLDEVVSKLSS